MPVISVSLNERNLESLDGLIDVLRLSGRSEAVRLCLRTAEAEVRERESFDGNLEGVLMMVHGTHSGNSLSCIERTHHRYKDVVMTSIHSHLESGKCLEVLILRGDASVVSEMISYFQRDDDIEYVRFLRG